MNKLSLIISGVLVLGLAYLFYETQQLKNELTKEEDQVETFEDLEEEDSELTVAFVRGDSIMLNYKFVQIEQDLLVSKARSSEIKIENQLRKAEAESQELITYMNSGSATQSDAQATERRMMELENQLAQLQQTEQQKIGKLEMEFQRELYERITTYLKKYGKENDIDMVFNHEFGGQTLMYTNDMLDVTEEVLVGLNSEYELEMAAEEEK